MPWRVVGFSTLLVVVVLALSACGSTTSTFEEPQPSGITGTVNGFVTDQATAGPVVGASISTIPGAGVIGVTDTAGFYQLSGVVAGTYQVIATRGPGKNASVLLQVTPNTTVRGNIIFNPVLADSQRDLIFLVDDVTGNTRIAMTSSRGSVSSPGGLTTTGVQGLTLQYRSLRMSRVSPSEAVMLSNSDHSTVPSVFDAYRLSIAGTSLTSTRLTNSTALKDSVDLSPDGQHIVLSQDTDGDGNFEVWLLDRNGQNATMLVSDHDATTGETFDNRAVAWSPEGSTIGFLTRRTDVAATFDERTFEVAVLPVGGGALTTVTSDLDSKTFMSWNPLDLTIFYTGIDGGHSQIFSVASAPNATANRLTHTIFDQSFPTLSHDQRQLAWVSTDDFDGTNSDHSQEVTIANPDGGGPFMTLTNIHAVTVTTTSNVTYSSVNFLQP